LPWGPVLHCRLSALRSAVHRAETLGVQAVVLTYLPLGAVEASAGGHPAGNTTATVTGLSACPDVGVALAMQRALLLASAAPSVPGMSAGDPVVGSALPLYLLSPRDGYALQSVLADVVSWAQHVTVGSSVDCRLPLSNRWHRGVVYSVLSSPFHRWLRVAFPDLPLSLWRWVERPQCRVLYPDTDHGAGQLLGRCSAPPIGDPHSKRLLYGAYDVMPPGVGLTCSALRPCGRAAFSVGRLSCVPWRLLASVRVHDYAGVQAG
jgi:hypothetical protein